MEELGAQGKYLGDGVGGVIWVAKPIRMTLAELGCYVVQGWVDGRLVYHGMLHAEERLPGRPFRPEVDGPDAVGRGELVAAGSIGRVQDPVAGVQEMGLPSGLQSHRPAENIPPCVMALADRRAAVLQRYFSLINQNGFDEQRL